MLKQARVFFAGFLCCAVIFGIVATVFAAPVQRAVTAVFSNIRIMINGNELVPRDAEGNIVEPFMIDGTTYLPVRAISEAFGMVVGWDGATQTINLTGTPTLQTDETDRFFFDSFINTPLDARWAREGSLTFDGQNGLSIEHGARLTLEGFSVANSDNYTIEFEAAILGNAGDRATLFGISLGTAANGARTDTLFGYLPEYNPAISAGIRHNNWVGLPTGSPTVADFDIARNVWYSIRINVINNQAHLFINDVLITSINMDFTVNHQITLGLGSAESQNHNIRNFSVTIND